MNKLTEVGQALVEYLIVFVFITFLGVQFINGFSSFLNDSFGNLGHVVSMNLTVGVCDNNCFFLGYKNGYTGTD